MSTTSPNPKPIRKVKAAGAAAAVSGFVDWVLATYVFHADVPAPVQGLVLVAVPGALTLAAAYFTKHAPEDLGVLPLDERIREASQDRRQPPPRPVEVPKGHPHMLGRHVEHDDRSRAFTVKATTAVRAKTWRHYGAVLDQGDLGSCTGNAMAQALNTEPLRAKGRVLAEPAAVALYEAATRLDSVPGSYPPHDTGSSGLAVAKAAQRAGFISGYRHSFSLEQLLQGLMAGPAIVGTAWTQDMFTPDDRGFVSPTGAEAGGHEYLCIGVDPAKKVLTFLNSWGKGWGLGGRFHMTFEDFESLLDNDGDAVFPVH